MRLQEHQIKTYCYGLKSGMIGDLPIETVLPEGKVIHTITLYIRAELQLPLMDQLLALNPKRIIFNPGTENPVFEEKARNASVEVLEACTLVMLGSGMYTQSKSN